MPDHKNRPQQSPRESAPEPLGDPSAPRPAAGAPDGERPTGSGGRGRRRWRSRPAPVGSAPDTTLKAAQSPSPDGAPAGTIAPTQPNYNRPSRRRQRGGRTQERGNNPKPGPAQPTDGDGSRDARGGQPPAGRDAQRSSGQGRPASNSNRATGSNRDGGRSNRRDSTRSTQPGGAPPAGQTGQPRRPNRAAATGQQRPVAKPSGRAANRGNSRTAGGGERNFYPPPTTPIKARGGIKARSEGDVFGKNWWARRWLIAMERLMDGARLQRGRRYARMGQILSMNEAGGGIVARVQGSRPQPYKVTIRISPFSDEQWEQVLDVLAEQAIFTAQLLAGEMPANIEDAFATAGVSLFPARGGDLMTDCSCPDWANPCKHIAATHYILGDRFDEDPFLIFRLRGRSQNEILQALRQRRSGQAEPEAETEEQVEELVLSLEEGLDHFWDIGAGAQPFSVNIQAPSIPLPILKRLGDLDAAGRISVEETLGPAYEAMSQFALMLAFSDINRENGENGQENG